MDAGSDVQGSAISTDIDALLGFSEEIGHTTGQEEDIIQVVIHEQPGARRDESMLQLQADEDWALHVEHRLHAPTEINAKEENPILDDNHADDDIYLLEYNRHPDSFRKALCEGAPLHLCRAALEEAGFNWMLDSGAKIFVAPTQYAESLDAITQCGILLRPYHVIVSEHFEDQVEACLTDLPYRQGARVKHRSVLRAGVEQIAAEAFDGEDCGTLQEDKLDRNNTVEEDITPSHLFYPVSATMEISEADKANNENDEDMAFSKVLTIKRTFLCKASRLRSHQSVTQSTTEANYGGINPRRICIVSHSD
jgi:hypothetical protein